MLKMCSGNATRYQIYRPTKMCKYKAAQLEMCKCIFKSEISSEELPTNKTSAKGAEPSKRSSTIPKPCT